MEKLSQAEKRWVEKFGKTFGDETLEMGTKVTPYEVISTGSLTLDYVLGVGGIVEGRLTEYWGPDGVGKSTLALLAVAEAHRKHPKKRAAWLDVEHKLDRSWAQSHGVDLGRFTVYTPSNAEDVADALKEMIRSGLFSICVLDSIGAMIPEAEKEKDADQAVMAQQAKIVTRMVKISASEAPKTSTAVLLVNQVRANLAYGADTTTGGGFALKHSTTHKMKFRRTATSPYQSTVLGDKVDVGHEIAVKVERNGVAPAYRTAIFNLFHVPTAKFGPLGVDRVDEAVTLGLKLGLIAQEGAWYTMPTTGERYQGREKLVAGLRIQSDEVEKLRDMVLATVASEVHEETPPEAIPEPEEPTPTNGKVAKKAAKKPSFRKGVKAASGE